MTEASEIRVIRVQMRYHNGAIVDTALPRKAITPTFWIDTQTGQACFERFLVLIDGGEKGKILKVFYRQVVDGQEFV